MRVGRPAGPPAPALHASRILARLEAPSALHVQQTHAAVVKRLRRPVDVVHAPLPRRDRSVGSDGSAGSLRGRCEPAARSEPRARPARGSRCQRGRTQRRPRQRHPLGRRPALRAEHHPLLRLSGRSLSCVCPLATGAGADHATDRLGRDARQEPLLGRIKRERRLRRPRRPHGLGDALHRRLARRRMPRRCPACHGSLLEHVEHPVERRRNIPLVLFDRTRRRSRILMACVGCIGRVGCTDGVRPSPRHIRRSLPRARPPPRRHAPGRRPPLVRTLALPVPVDRPGRRRRRRAKRPVLGHHRVVIVVVVVVVAVGQVPVGIAPIGGCRVPARHAHTRPVQRRRGWRPQLTRHDTPRRTQRRRRHRQQLARERRWTMENLRKRKRRLIVVFRPVLPPACRLHAVNPTTPASSRRIRRMTRHAVFNCLQSCFTCSVQPDDLLLFVFRSPVRPARRVASVFRRRRFVLECEPHEEKCFGFRF